MTEKLITKSPEQGIDNPETTPLTSPEVTVTPEQQVEKLESARKAVQELAPARERLALPVDDKPADNRPLYIDRTVKALQLKQSLQQVRSQLPLVSRTMSKIIHQPLVKVTSEVSAKTVTRPSGLLGGGLVAFVGSLTYLYLASHIGFRYNYLVFILFFGSGFAIGLVLELLFRLSRSRRQQ